MTRCHQHLELLRDLEQRPARTGFSFNIMDEIFVSTNYLEGMSGAYAVIKHLGTLQNSCHIITTHFDKLVSAGNQSGATTIPGYANKYFRIEMLGDPLAENPEISKDYLLRDGVNDRHLALHLLKLRGFDAELVQDAREMYTRLTAPTVINTASVLNTPLVINTTTDTNIQKTDEKHESETFTSIDSNDNQKITLDCETEKVNENPVTISNDIEIITEPLTIQNLAEPTHVDTT
jgi:DNA mismatch repair ATPase MutS